MKIKRSYTIRIVIMAITFGAICFSACKDKRKDNITKIVKEWTGEKIRFPEGLICTSIERDTTCLDFHGGNFKILLYVDSLGCTSCHLQQLSAWKKTINKFDTIFTNPPEFIFIFQPKKRDESELRHIFRSNGFRSCFCQLRISIVV